MKNTKFSTWSSRSVPSNGIENEMPSCQGPKSAHCVSVNKETIQGLGLIDTTCSSSGFTCKDSDQTKYDPENKIRCTDFQARFECPYRKGRALLFISENFWSFLQCLKHLPIQTIISFHNRTER